MLLGTVGQPLLLEIVLNDRATTVFPRAKVIDQASGLVTTLPMLPCPVFAGLYQATWASPVAGHYSIPFEVFADNGFTELTDHDPDVEHARIVTDFELALLKLLAHQGENVRDEVLTPDVSSGRPLSARRKLYATRADALADVNVVATVDVSATYATASSWNELVRTLTP